MCWVYPDGLHARAGMKPRRVLVVFVVADLVSAVERAGVLQSQRAGSSVLRLNAGKPYIPCLKRSFRSTAMPCVLVIVPGMAIRSMPSTATAARTGAMLLLVALLTACKGQRAATPPPVNAHPGERILITVDTLSAPGPGPVTYEATANYGTGLKACSEILPPPAGAVIPPSNDLRIMPDEPGRFIVYRDYYQPRATCPWEFFGVALRLHDRRDRSSMLSILAMELAEGYQQTYYCNLAEGVGGFCNPERKPSTLSDADFVHIRVSIAVGAVF